MRTKKVTKKRDNLEGRWLQQAAAAKYLGVSIATFKVWRKKYDDFPTPVEMSPTALMFDKQDLDAWIEKRKAEAKAEVA